MRALEPVLAAALAFATVFGLLRVAEWLYHRLRHTRDWSPHWGSWLFAILAGLYALVNSLGR
jgi:hypothetical protein